MALVRSKSIKQNVGEICAEKGQRESGSKKNECLTVGNPFGHCGETSAKSSELIARLDKLLDLSVLIVWHGNHAVKQG